MEKFNEIAERLEYFGVQFTFTSKLKTPESSATYKFILEDPDDDDSVIVITSISIDNLLAKVWDEISKWNEDPNSVNNLK